MSLWPCRTQRSGFRHFDALDLPDQIGRKRVESDARIFLPFPQHPGVTRMKAIVLRNSKSGLLSHYWSRRLERGVRGYRQSRRGTEPEIVDGDDYEEGQQYEKYGHDALDLWARRLRIRQTPIYREHVSNNLYVLC